MYCAKQHVEAISPLALRELHRKTRFFTPLYYSNRSRERQGHRHYCLALPTLSSPLRARNVDLEDNALHAGVVVRYPVARREGSG
jgi:transposase